MGEPAMNIGPYPGHPDVIRLFEEGLMQARAGKIVGCAFAVVFDNGRPALSVGGVNPMVLYYGCDKLKQVLAQSIDGPPSSIIKARGN